MSKYACLARNSERAISAEEAFFKYGKDRVYYCPNSGCRAEMVLCSRNGEKYHYFRSLKNAHCSDCFVKNSREDKKGGQLYLGDRFSPTSFLQSLVNENHSSNNRGYTKKKNVSDYKRPVTVKLKVKTIDELYHYCIERNIFDSAGGTIIGKLLLDERSSSFHEDSLSGIHLVKCEFRRYNQDDNLLYFKISDNRDIRVYIDDANLYKEIKKICFEAKDKCRLLLFGHWKKDKMNLYAKKQIKLLMAERIGMS